MLYCFDSFVRLTHAEEDVLFFFIIGKSNNIARIRSSDKTNELLRLLTGKKIDINIVLYSSTDFFKLIFL